MLSGEEAQSLLLPVTKDDVFSAHESLYINIRYKAPGPDGFQLVFYNKFWHIVGASVHHMVNQAFLTGVCPANLADCAHP